MKPTLREIDTENRVALFEDPRRLFSVEYDIQPNGYCCITGDLHIDDDYRAYITKSIDAYLLALNGKHETKGKQERYLDDEGKDLIDEWAETYPIETFRVLMWEQMRKYHRRLGKKDDVRLEVLKIADYARRWAEVETK